jgi:meso-butanediol dehydrogenase/(S,S)-butanediol dehydrogenase/diacetyl reductase
MAAPAKTVLITGAARGLGQGIAFRLAADGFNVALNDINLQELQKTWDILSAKAHNVIMVPGDVSVDADVQQIITQTVAEFGHLDVVCALTRLTIPLLTFHGYR